MRKKTLSGEILKSLASQIKEHSSIDKSLSPGEISETNDQGSANVPLNSAELHAKEYQREKVARVSYSRRVRRITLERYLVSKLVHHPGETTFEDLLVIYDNILYLQDLAERDPGFREKFGKTLEVLAKILKAQRFSRANFPGSVEGLSRKLRDLEGFILPERNLQGTERHLKGLYQIQPYRESGKLKSQLPPKTYIGKGYRDKGHRTDPAYDGSPSWQEVIRGGVE